MATSRDEVGERVDIVEKAESRNDPGLREPAKMVMKAPRPVGERGISAPTKSGGPAIGRGCDHPSGCGQGRCDFFELVNGEKWEIGVKNEPGAR